MIIGLLLFIGGAAIGMFVGLMLAGHLAGEVVKRVLQEKGIR